MYQILLAEDDPAQRYVYTKLKTWIQYGFEIADEVSNGKEALDKLDQKTYDAVITDIRMPAVDGLTLLKEMKKRNISCRAILISSYDEFEYARQGLILGAFDYIVKPMKPDNLGKVLSRLHEELAAAESKQFIHTSILQVLENNQIDLSDNPFLSNICTYLSDHMGSWVTMEDTAKKVKYSKDYFSKTFKQQTGMSFHAFYEMVKVEYAKYLIDTENRRNYEISEILGYSSPDYFTKVFKEVTGMTPAQYRKRK